MVDLVNLRVPLAFEGVKTVDGRVVLSLYWEDLPVPVFIRSPSSLESSMIHVGEIVRLERINRVVWADISLKMEMPQDYILSLEGMCGQILTDCYDPTVILIQSMRVAGGLLIPREEWAWKNVSVSF